MTQGWEQDGIFAPHRVLRTPLGFDESHQSDEVGPAALVTVAGRPALATFGLPTADGSYYSVVDLETGARVPDRSGLHGSKGPRAAAVGMCGDRAVLALLLQSPADGDDGVRVLRLRDVWSGEPIDVEFPRIRRDWPIAVATIDGRGIVAAGATVYDARDGSVIAQHDGTGYVKALAEHQGRLLQVRYDVLRRAHFLQDALTGAAVGEPFGGRELSTIATVVVDGHLWVVFPGRYADRPGLAWDVTDGREADLPPLWDAESVGDRPIDNLRLQAQDGDIIALVQWGYEGRNGTEVWLPAPHGGRRLGVDFGRSSALALGVLDGRTAAVAGYHGRSLKVFDVEAGTLVPSPYYAGYVESDAKGRNCSFVDVGGRGSLLVCGATGVVWDFESGLPVGTAPFGDGVRTIAAGVVDGRAMFAVLTGGRSDTVPTALRVWDPQTSRTVFYRELPAESERFRTWDNPMTFVEFAGQPTVARRFNRGVEFYDARTGVLVGSITVENMKRINVLATGRIGGRTLLAAGDAKGPVQVWDSSTGREAGPVLPGHRIDDGLPKINNQSVSAIAFAQVSGRQVVVTGGGDRTVRLWDLATGEAIGTPFAGHPGEITALLPTHWDGQAAVISVASTGAPRMWMMGAPSVDTGHTGQVTALTAGTREGRPAFASSSADGTIRLWDAATGRIVDSIAVGRAQVTAVVFGGPARDILIGVTEDGLVQRWDVNSGAALGAPLHRGDKPMYAADTVEMDGRSLVGVAGADQTLRIWDVVTGEQVAHLPVGRFVGSVALAAAGGRLLAFVHGGTADDERCAGDSVAALWDVSAGQPIGKPIHLSEGGEVAALGVRNGRVVRMHGLDADAEDYSYHGPSEDDLELRDALTGDLIAAFKQHGHGHGRSGAVVMVEAAGRTLIVAGFANGVALLDNELREVSEHYREHKTSMVNCVAATEVDGDLVVASSDDANAVHIWRPFC